MLCAVLCFSGNAQSNSRNFQAENELAANEMVFNDTSNCTNLQKKNCIFTTFLDHESLLDFNSLRKCYQITFFPKKTITKT